MLGSFTVTRDAIGIISNAEGTSISHYELHMQVSGQTSTDRVVSIQGQCAVKQELIDPINGRVYTDETFSSPGAGFSYSDGMLVFAANFNVPFDCRTPDQYYQTPYTTIGGFIKSSGSQQLPFECNGEVIQQCSDRYTWDITIPVGNPEQ